MNEFHQDYTPINHISTFGQGITSVISDVLYVKGIIVVLLSDGKLHFINRQLKPDVRLGSLAGIDCITANEDILVCVGGNKVAIYILSEANPRMIGMCQTDIKYDKCHITGRGDFICLTSDNIVDCFGVTYSKLKPSMTASIVHLDRNSDFIGLEEYVTSVTSCFDEVSSKTYFFISDSDCQLLMFEVELNQMSKKYELVPVTTLSLDSSAGSINMICNCGKPGDEFLGLASELKGMAVSNEMNFFINMDKKRTRSTKAMNCDYFIEAKHPEHPAVQEFVAVKSLSAGEVIDETGSPVQAYTPPPTQATFYTDNLGVLMQTRTLRVTGVKCGADQCGMGYGRARVSPSISNLESMDAGQVMSIQKVIVVDAPDGGDLIITTTLDGGITIWKKCQ